MAKYNLVRRASLFPTHDAQPDEKRVTVHYYCKSTLPTLIQCFMYHP